MQFQPIQMALPVTLPDDETFSAYFGGEESLEVNHLKAALENRNEDFQFTYLCGLADSGKSHFLYSMSSQLKHMTITTPITALALCYLTMVFKHFRTVPAHVIGVRICH